MKFSIKLALFFSSLFLVVTIIVILSLTIFSHDILREEIANNLEEQSFHTMDKIDRALSYRLTHLLHLRDIIQENTLDSENKINSDEIARRFANFMRKNKDFLSLSLYDMNRVRIVDTLEEDIGKQHGLNEYWPDIISGKGVVFDMYYSESLKRPVFHFAFLIKDLSGHPVGVFVVRIPPEDIDDIILQAGGMHPNERAMVHSGQVKVDIAQNDGLLVYSSYNRLGILKDMAPQWERIKEEFKRGNLWDSYESDPADSGGELVVFAHERGYNGFTGNGWTLIVRIPSNFVYAPASVLTKKLLFILFATGCICLVGVFLFSRTVSRPIEKLDLAVAQISNGNFDTVVEIASKDEIGHLANNFNQMTRQLVHSTYLIKEYTANLENEIAIRELAEKRLKELLAEMDTILQTAEVGIAHLVNRRAVWVNPQIERIYGYSREELLREENISMIYPSVGDYETFGREIASLIATGGVYHGEMKMKRKDGTLIWCKIMGKAVDHTDISKGVIWVTEDITERRRAVHELRIAKDRAEEATQLKDKFVSLVAHDLKSPLASVYSLLKLVLDHDKGALPDYAKQSISRAVQSSGQMIQLIENLLDLGMLRVGKIKPACEVTDVWLCVIEAISDVEHHFSKKGVRLVNMVPEHSFQFTDPKLLARVIQNLLSNAVKFCKPGDTATVFIPEGRPSTIGVKDTGVGMRADVIANLFEYTGSVSTHGTNGEKGTGMGLPISYEIVRAMGGNLHVESQEGKGSVFYIDMHLQNPGVASA
ncbi:MAG: HAMP domain-containing protein [Nitrospinae bacterium]|nr:HAMP domain-containing protein [Nitrospinota bacterium]